MPITLAHTTPADGRGSNRWRVMKRFEEGQEYVITQDARFVSIARVVRRDGDLATFAFHLAGKTRRFSSRIRTVGGSRIDVVVPTEYDAIFAYNALRSPG